jgi:hypothetical protein
MDEQKASARTCGAQVACRAFLVAHRRQVHMAKMHGRWDRPRSDASVFAFRLHAVELHIRSKYESACSHASAMVI